MINKTIKKEQTRKRHLRIRKKVSGTADCPRLSFYRSNKHIYAQLIDDDRAATLLSCSTLQPSLKLELSKTWSLDSAKKLGTFVAKIALEKGIKKAIFDRGGFRFHGKAAAFVQAANESGLKL